MFSTISYISNSAKVGSTRFWYQWFVKLRVNVGMLVA